MPTPPTCLRCAYDLRGLPPTSNCPECGLSVSFSLSPPTTLSSAPPSWARTLALGAALLFLSAIAFPVSRFIGTFFPMNLNATTAEIMHWLYLEHSIILAIFIFHALAIWVITTREPRTPRFTRRQLGLWIARFGSLGPPATFAWLIYSEIYNIWFRHFYALYLPLFLYLPVPALIFLHLRRLSARIGRPRLAEHAGIVGIGLSSSLTALSLLFLMQMQTTSSFLLACIILPFACLILGYFWALYLLFRLTLAFTRAISEARTTWTQADATAPTP